MLFAPQTIKITDGGLDDPRVQALLAHHLHTARAATAQGSAHALDLSGLKSADNHFWSAWDSERVVAVGALKRLTNSHGEVKSMHTEQASRRKGAGSAMLRHIIAQARAMKLVCGPTLRQLANSTNAMALSSVRHLTPMFPIQTVFS